MKLVIIDRDGVVSRDADGRMVRPEDWRPVAGSPQAIARFNHAGVRVALMTDCGTLARGVCDMTMLNALHARILDDVAHQGGRIDAVLFVPPTEAADRCTSAAQAIIDLLDRMHIDPADTSLITDSRHELDAAHAAGCRPVLVLSGHGRRTLQAGALPPDTIVRVDLAAVAAELAQ